MRREEGKREHWKGGWGGGPLGGCCEVKVPVFGVRWPPARVGRTLQRQRREDSL